MLKILKLFFVLLLVLLILGSCADNEKSNLSEKLNTNKQQNGGDRKEETAHENEIIDPTLSSQEKIYVLFSLSTHDWVFPEESIAVLNKMIDIHEKYNVPIELYLDDQVMQIYYEQSPELIERLKTSPVVAVSYHIRPPTPYYKELEFDFIGLEALDEITLKETLLDYEEHAIDLETGEPTNAAGGYEFVKDIIGYAPLTVSGFEKYGDLGTVLRNLYYEKGALFLVLHSQLGDEDPTAVDLGEKREPLYARPSTVDVRLFESVGQDTIAVLQEAEQKALGAGISPVFLSIKMHEDDFYADGVSPWRYTYYNMDEKRKSAQTPPYDITAGKDAALLAEEERDAMWQHYENAVVYVASQDNFEAIHSFDLKEMVGT